MVSMIYEDLFPLKVMDDFERYCSNADMMRRIFDKIVELRE